MGEGRGGGSGVLGGGRRTGHEGVAEVVLAVLVVFYVFPFERGAAAAVESEVLV